MIPQNMTLNAQLKKNCYPLHNVKVSDESAGTDVKAAEEFLETRYDDCGGNLHDIAKIQYG